MFILERLSLCLFLPDAMWRIGCVYSVMFIVCVCFTTVDLCLPGGSVVSLYFKLINIRLFHIVEMNFILQCL